ncbi:MAG: hypothetical protein LBQ13_04295 [Endomicrobium sp.]|jgi:hypothetical protein|nr:hypothetical protein [Endomicrobium sp.]
MTQIEISLGGIIFLLGIIIILIILTLDKVLDIRIQIYRLAHKKEIKTKEAIDGRKC